MHIPPLKVVTKPPLPLLLSSPRLLDPARGGGGAVARKDPPLRDEEAVPPDELLCASPVLCSRQAASRARCQALHAMHRPAHALLLLRAMKLEAFKATN